MNILGDICEKYKVCKKDYFINHSIYYKSQQKFDDLRGVHNGLLSYDFYLPDYNCLIEFQGEQHEKSIKYFGKEKFKSQIEHDKRKREYAENNGYKVIHIKCYNSDFNYIKKEIVDTLYDIFDFIYVCI